VTRAIVVMGVAGCGKSTLGAALATMLDWVFIEGDELHPPENVEKMQAGIPLNDADREPLLNRVGARLNEHRSSGVVASCSALKRRYRDTLRQQAGDIDFVLPLLDRELLMQRVSRRTDHFMPVELLDSQLETFEMPEVDEQVITVDGAMATDEQVSSVIAALRERQQGQ
jgi:gluconokinase